MSTWTNQSKNSASFTNQSANSATFSIFTKAGEGWQYNRPNLKYNETIDPLTGLRVTYNSLGVTTSFSNLSKN